MVHDSVEKANWGCHLLVGVLDRRDMNTLVGCTSAAWNRSGDARLVVRDEGGALLAALDANGTVGQGSGGGKTP